MSRTDGLSTVKREERSLSVEAPLCPGDDEWETWRAADIPASMFDDPRSEEECGNVYLLDIAHPEGLPDFGEESAAEQEESETAESSKEVQQTRIPVSEPAAEQEESELSNSPTYDPSPEASGEEAEREARPPKRSIALAPTPPA